MNLAGNSVFTSSESNGGLSDAPGSTIELTQSGALNNTAKTLALDSTTGPLTLDGGGIFGGTITETGTGQLLFDDPFTNSNNSGTFTPNFLNDVTMFGNLDLSQVNGASAGIYSGLTLDGSILIGNAAGTTSGDLGFGGPAPSC